MVFPRKYSWSVSSIVLSGGILLLTAWAGMYYPGRGWEVDQPPRWLGLLDLIAVPASFVTACVALGKEPSRTAGILALMLSVLSFFCAVSSY